MPIDRRPRQTEPVNWELPRMHRDESMQVDFPRDAPEMDEEQILEYLMSLQPERLREMSHRPGPDRRDPGLLEQGFDAVGEYFDDRASRPMPPLVGKGKAAGRFDDTDASRSIEQYIPPELRKLLRLPVNVGVDVADFFRPETPGDVALGAMGFFGPAAGALNLVKKGYKSGLKTRGYQPGEVKPGYNERVNTRRAQAGVLTDVTERARRSLYEDDPGYAGGGKVTRRGVLKGLGALGAAGVLGKKGLKLGDEAAEVAVPIERNLPTAARAASKLGWMPPPQIMAAGRRYADQIEESAYENMVDDMRGLGDSPYSDGYEDETKQFVGAIRKIFDDSASEEDRLGALLELKKMHERPPAFQGDGLMDDDVAPIVDLLRMDDSFPWVNVIRSRDEPDADWFGRELEEAIDEREYNHLFDTDLPNPTERSGSIADWFRNAPMTDDLSGPNDFLNKAIKND